MDATTETHLIQTINQIANSLSHLEMDIKTLLFQVRGIYDLMAQEAKAAQAERTQGRRSEE